MNKETIGAALQRATKELSSAGVDSARLDALLLLEHVTGRARSTLLAHDDEMLPTAAAALLKKCMQLRINHTPIAYILGRVEFYGYDFIVNEAVLIPRPESEAMIELLKSVQLESGSMIVDVGTGSGCLAIVAALTLPSHPVLAIDTDIHCLAIAKRNAARHDATMTYLESDLLRALSDEKRDQIGIILANLPYVPTRHPINRAAGHEPSLALFGGDDGLDLYRRLFEQTGRIPYVITESLMSQHESLAGIAHSAGYTLAATIGLAQLFHPHP